MKERPIPMSAPMVRALLAGTKTQTRRVVKLQPYSVALVASGNHLFDYRADLNDYSRVVPMDKAVTLCPYGQPGDRLWVREAWRAERQFDVLPPRDITRHVVAYEAAEPGAGYAQFYGKLRPGMFMPRWASRITLEVTGVRIARLQDISEADAIAEGIERTVIGDDWRRYVDRESELAGVHPCMTPRASYQSLWESINGAGSWDANPWVWAISFRRL